MFWVLVFIWVFYFVDCLFFGLLLAIAASLFLRVLFCSGLPVTARMFCVTFGMADRLRDTPMTGNMPANHLCHKNIPDERLAVLV